MIYVLTPDKKVVTVLANDGGHSCPFYSDLHTEMLVEFDSSYTFSAPTDNYPETSNLVVGNYVAIMNMDDEAELFRITNTVDGFDGSGNNVTVTAENAAIFDLNGTIIRPHNFVGMTAEQQFDFILQDSGWEPGTCDIIDSKDPSITDYSTAQADLHSIADAYGADVKFRVDLSGNRIVHQYIDLIQQRGTNNGKRFEYGKDIQGVQRTINITDNFATALIPQGANDANGNPINITSVNGGLDYIANEDANKQFNPTTDNYIYKVYTNDKMNTPAALLADSQTQLAIVSKPEITYDTTVILLERLAGFAHESVRLGDSVDVIDKQMNPTLTVQARVIQLDISYSDHSQDKATLGDYVTVQDVTPTIVNKIQQQVSKVVGNLDTSAFKVEIAASNGTTFKNSQGTTDLIARVYNGKDPITSDIQPSDFIWYKINKDGTHDTAWEQAHTNVGNTVTVTAADITSTATFQCQINQGVSDPVIVANETDFNLVAILTNEFNDSPTTGGTLAQSIWVDNVNQCIYWAYVYTGSKVGSYTLNQSYCLLRTDMSGSNVLDQMWCIGGAHASTIGFELVGSQMYIYSNYMNATTGNYTLVRFPYTAGKTLLWGDSSIQDLGITNNDDTRISIDQAHNMACIAIDNRMGNVDISVMDLSLLKQGISSILYSLKSSDYGFDDANQQWQAHTLCFPYLYQSAGVWDFSQPKMMYCVDVRTKELVYSINFKLNTTAIVQDGWDSEPEGMGFYVDSNNVRHIQYTFGMGTGTERISKIYSVVENIRSDG